VQARKRNGLIGATLRTLQFDAWVRDFLDRHPSGTVGNSAPASTPSPMPDVMALRRTFFQDTDRRHTLAASVTEIESYRLNRYRIGDPHAR